MYRVIVSHQRGMAVLQLIEVDDPVLLGSGCQQLKMCT